MCKTKVIAGILILIAFVGLPMGVQAQSDDGLVAEWHFDEGEGSVLKDSSGNGNDGVIYGATWVEGKYGQALSFDGKSDYVDIGSSINPAHITVAAWWYGASFRGDGNDPIVCKGYTSHKPPYYQYHLGVVGINILMSPELMDSLFRLAAIVILHFRRIHTLLVDGTFLLELMMAKP